MPPFPSQRATKLGKAVLECWIDSRKEREREKEKRREKYTVLPSETHLLTDVSYCFSICVSLRAFYACHSQSDIETGQDRDDSFLGFFCSQTAQKSAKPFICTPSLRSGFQLRGLRSGGEVLNPLQAQWGTRAQQLTSPQLVV